MTLPDRLRAHPDITHIHPDNLHAFAERLATIGNNLNVDLDGHGWILGIERVSGPVHTAAC